MVGPIKSIACTTISMLTLVAVLPAAALADTAVTTKGGTKTVSHDADASAQTGAVVSDGYRRGNAYRGLATFAFGHPTAGRHQGAYDLRHGSALFRGNTVWLLDGGPEIHAIHASVKHRMHGTP